MRVDIDFVKKLLADRGWSKAEFARRSGLSRAYVSKLFNGSRMGGLAVLNGLMKAFPEYAASDFLLPADEREEDAP